MHSDRQIRKIVGSVLAFAEGALLQELQLNSVLN